MQFTQGLVSLALEVTLRRSLRGYAMEVTLRRSLRGFAIEAYLSEILGLTPEGTRVGGAAIDVGIFNTVIVWDGRASLAAI